MRVRLRVCVNVGVYLLNKEVLHFGLHFLQDILLLLQTTMMQIVQLSHQMITARIIVATVRGMPTPTTDPTAGSMMLSAPDVSGAVTIQTQLVLLLR